MFFLYLKLQSAELRDRLLYEIGGKLPAEKKEQAVANYVQRANIKKNAALAIKVMYKKILDILKKVWYKNNDYFLCSFLMCIGNKIHFICLHVL